MSTVRVIQLMFTVFEPSKEGNRTLRPRNQIKSLKTKCLIQAATCPEAAAIIPELLAAKPG